MTIDDWRALGFRELVPDSDVWEGPGGWILERYDPNRIFLRDPGRPGSTYDGAELDRADLLPLLLRNGFPRPDLVTALVTPS